MIHQTTGQESLKSIVKQARREEYTMMVAVGGDGTVSEMVDGLVGRQIPLGIVPLGTGNWAQENILVQPVSALFN